MVNYDDYDYDYNQPPKNKKSKKKKNNVAKLLFIFISTFFGVLIIFLLLAKMLTPAVDIPEVASGNNNLPQPSEEDSFRQRIDSSLFDISNDEKFPQALVPNEDKTQKQQDESPEDKNTELNDKQTQPQNPFEDDFFKDDYNNSSKNTEDTSSSSSQRASVPMPPAPVPSPKQIEPAQPQKIIAPTYKVLVGSFATPEEARLLAKEMSSDGYSVTPFIRLINGKYAVQAGSFNDVERARATANTLNHYYDGVKIIEEF